MKLGDIVAWRYGDAVQVGVIDSLNSYTAWLYRLVPAGRQTSRLAKPLDALTIVVRGAELQPLLLRQASAAVAPPAVRS